MKILWGPGWIPPKQQTEKIATFYLKKSGRHPANQTNSHFRSNAGGKCQLGFPEMYPLHVHPLLESLPRTFDKTALHDCIVLKLGMD